MYHRIVRIITYIIFCLSLVLLTCGFGIRDSFSSSAGSSILDKLLSKKIDYYKRLYPEILFLVLQGGEETLNSMISLDIILGFQPSSLDYEHPPELREDLMYVSAARIHFMLENNAPSASLFRADDPYEWQEHVCVLTIAPEEIAADSLRATAYLLDLPDEAILNFPEKIRLQSKDYLNYVIDHEVYHCLYAMYVGPQKMSSNELWAEYNEYLHEQGADVYAVAMQLKLSRSDSLFAANLRRIRGMSLYNADPDHLTLNALNQLLNIPRDKVALMTQKEIFELANQISAEQTLSYDDYVKYLAAAIDAMRLLGVDESEFSELRERMPDVHADPQLVNKLVAASYQSFAELINETHKQTGP